MKSPDPAQEELPLSSIKSHILFAGRINLYVGEVAAALRMSDSQVHDLIAEGKIIAVNISGDPTARKYWRIPVAAYDAFIEGNKSV